MTEGLHPRDPDFAALIRGAGGDVREVAIAAAQRALASVPVAEPPVSEVLALLDSSNLEAAVRHRDALVALAEKADEEYFRLSEPESSQKESRQATTLFRRARALSALANVLVADPREAAWEAIYETHAALPDEDLAQFINDMKGHLRRLQAKE